MLFGDCWTVNANKHMPDLAHPDCRFLLWPLGISSAPGFVLAADQAFSRKT